MLPVGGGVLRGRCARALDARNLAQPGRDAGARGRHHGQAFERLRVGEHALDADGPGAVACLERAAGGVAPPRGHRVGHVGGEQAARGQRLGVGADEDFRVAQARGVDLVHTGDALQVRLDAPRVDSQGFVVGLAHQHQRGGGEAVAGGDLQNHRVFGFARQLAGGLVLDFAPQVGHALVEGALVDLAKAHQHAGDVLARTGDDEAHVGHALDRVFQRVCDQSLDLFGAGALQHGADADPVEVDLGVLLARHGVVADQP
ncbi:hypothetical protein D9M68_739880 [compost metagenome]